MRAAQRSRQAGRLAAAKPTGDKNRSVDAGRTDPLQDLFRALLTQPQVHGRVTRRIRMPFNLDADTGAALGHDPDEPGLFNPARVGSKTTAGEVDTRLRRQFGKVILAGIGGLNVLLRGGKEGL
ncbi:MAG: hypothetical protein AAFO58_12200 [Pseudomonadota bacterium]